MWVLGTEVLEPPSAASQAHWQKAGSEVGHGTCAAVRFLTQMCAFDEQTTVILYPESLGQTSLSAHPVFPDKTVLFLLECSV